MKLKASTKFTLSILFVLLTVFSFYAYYYYKHYKRPYAVLISPENKIQLVSEHASISTSILKLPNGSINRATVKPSTVYLKEASTGAIIPSRLSVSRKGNVITLVPNHPLKLNTTYIFTVTRGVKDLSGASFIPYTSTFTTGSASSKELLDVKFEKVRLPNAPAMYSSLTFGPDGKLYALGIDGIISRFSVLGDGTLSDPELIYSLQDASGKRQQRLSIGLTFDPSSTANNLIAYVSNSTFVFQDGPDWDGKLTRLSGPKLENVQDLLIHLPRSYKDHLTNSLAFGPDGALYFPQGSNSALGEADKTWGFRKEHLLSATILRLDLKMLGKVLPLDVKTPEGGGTYNPYAPDAPLTIYATGIRNAYDLVWHSNGELYVPNNGSAPGGNTPASIAGARRPDGSLYKGPSIPSLAKVKQIEKDLLFRIHKGGYYGHPNPLRGEYVLNGGNPTDSTDPAQTDDYPVGTLPDANWQGFVFDFHNNKSPNGVIEYKSNAFGGALKGKLIIARYSTDDLITLSPCKVRKGILNFVEGSAIEGFSGLVMPLDLIEDTKTGNIYVSEYGTGGISLLRPKVTNNPISMMNTPPR
ncbi:Ig-like domain-containing protein [Chitinophagaceae bacterium LB-8]|uniref:Ig-like domain-containing protein n=1 Tax=Paraflavisolibacter caeni TaxID=2982496 RepID=A0A9X2XSZ3_9BACT|nr:Ig-like domain-containing protein [Paraflavisolibacter caeni]MCU7547711.1 Ig-like domain-containing protein [Paraflavisolibacter caeni]